MGCVCSGCGCSQTTENLPSAPTKVEEKWRVSSNEMETWSTHGSETTQHQPLSHTDGKGPRCWSPTAIGTLSRHGSETTERQRLLTSQTEVKKPRSPSPSDLDTWSSNGSESQSLFEIEEEEPEEEPWCLSPWKMETWFKNNISNSLWDFDKDCKKAVNSVVRHISTCNNFTVDKIIKGGSLGKDTMLADYSDVDLVAFVNPPDLKPISKYWSPRDYQNQLKTVIKEFEDSLCELPSVTINRTNDYLVNFDVQVGKRTVSVDLLPTANNDHPDVYSEMMNQTSSHRERGLYSASFVEKQRDFVSKQPDIVRNLIRMVKYWAYTCLPECLHKSYPLELITIYCWEKAGKPEKFEIVEGLKAVLEVLESQPWKRRKFWTDYYSKDLALDTIETLGMKYPVMLDPANPTNNVLHVYQQGDNMKKIQNAARMTLETPLLWEACSLLT